MMLRALTGEMNFFTEFVEERAGAYLLFYMSIHKPHKYLRGTLLQKDHLYSLHRY